MKLGQKVGLGISAVAGVIFVAILWLPLFSTSPSGSVSWAGLPRILLILFHWDSGWAADARHDIWIAAIQCSFLACIGGIIYWLSGVPGPSDHQAKQLASR